MIISGQLFNSLCVWSIDSRYPLRIWTAQTFKEYDSIFLKISDIPTLLSNPPPTKAILVIHNSDETFTDEMYSTLDAIASKIYAANCSSKRAIQIPLGFRDDMYTSHSTIEKIKSDVVTKDVLCLVNFSLATNPCEREKTFNTFNGRPLFYCDSDYLTYKGALCFTNPETINRREYYYNLLNRSKFVICPVGTGVDTHRVYESILFGAIPIVKTSFLDPLYSKLPVLIVNEWTDVTTELLVSYNTLCSYDTFTNPRRWLHLSYNVSFITYANNVYNQAGKRIIKEAQSAGIFDTIKLYSPSDLDSTFTKQNEYLLSHDRGGGYWCWKSYVILNSLKDIPEGNWLLYADAGCTLVYDRRFQLIDRIRYMENQGKEIAVFQMTHLEKTYTKGDTLKFFNVEKDNSILDSGQYIGGIVLMKNTQFVRDVFTTIQYIIHNHPNYIDDSPSFHPNDSTFIEHRHDQSIYSILLKRSPVDKVFVIPTDETYHGNDFVQAIRSRS